MTYLDQLFLARGIFNIGVFKPPSGLKFAPGAAIQTVIDRGVIPIHDHSSFTHGTSGISMLLGLQHFGRTPLRQRCQPSASPIVLGESLIVRCLSGIA